MNKEQLQKDLQETLKKYGLDIQHVSIDHEKISNDFYTTNANIWDSSECWFDNLEVNKTNWLLSEYGKNSIQLEFNIGDYELIYNAVLRILHAHTEHSEYVTTNKIHITNEIIEAEFGDFEETTLKSLKTYLPENIFDEILEEIIYAISNENFHSIEENLYVWFGIEYPEETFNEFEALAYWTVYFQPRIENEELAWELNLIPFWFDGEFYLALGGCGMDLSPKLDAYQALTDGTVPRSSRFRDDTKYAKHVVKEKVFNKVMETIKCDPIIHIHTCLTCETK
jgi:hypothetical protein